MIFLRPLSAERRTEVQASFALTVQGCGYVGPILLDFSKCKAFAFQCFALYTVAWVPVPTFPSFATSLWPSWGCVGAKRRLWLGSISPHPCLDSGHSLIYLHHLPGLPSASGALPYLYPLGDSGPHS